MNLSSEIHINPNQLVLLPISIFCWEQNYVIIQDALMENLWKRITRGGEMREEVKRSRAAPCYECGSSLLESPSQ